MPRKNILDIFDETLLQVAEANPRIKEYQPYFKAARVVIKAQRKEFEKPKTWEDLLKLVLFIMAYIPQAAPFVFLVKIVGEYIIEVLRQQEKAV